MPPRKKAPQKTLPEADIPPLVFSENPKRNERESDNNAATLAALFYYRRILDHQALSLCVRAFKPLHRVERLSEREIKLFFAQHHHLRGYVDAAQLASPSQRVAATRYGERVRGWMESSMRGKLMMQNHPLFPERLSRIAFPIHWLFSHPAPLPKRLPQPVVAIIGSRQSTRLQLQVAAQVAEAVGRVRGTVITGLATGADGAAHEAAVDTEASIVAVLGSGVGKPYPPANARWVPELMAGRGYVLTEVPPDYTPNEDAFVLRNRIVAGLADFVVAVSGKYASGTSHTVRFASDVGIQVVSADPSTSSGITKLVEELGGHFATVSDIEQMLIPGEL